MFSRTGKAKEASIDDDYDGPEQRQCERSMEQWRP